jgi:hypothetical protein
MAAACNSLQSEAGLRLGDDFKCASMPSQWAKWWAGEHERTITNRYDREKLERRDKISNGWGNS